MLEEVGPKGAEEAARMAQVKHTVKCRDLEMRRAMREQSSVKLKGFIQHGALSEGLHSAWPKGSSEDSGLDPGSNRHLRVPSPLCNRSSTEVLSSRGHSRGRERGTHLVCCWRWESCRKDLSQ